MPNYQEDIVKRFLEMVDHICIEKSLNVKDFIASMPGINLSGSAISQLKSRRILSIDAHVIAEICAKYKFSVEWVLLGKGEKKADREAKRLDQELKQIKELLVVVVQELGKGKPKIAAILEDLIENYKK